MLTLVWPSEPPVASHVDISFLHLVSSLRISGLVGTVCSCLSVEADLRLDNFKFHCIAHSTCLHLQHFSVTLKHTALGAISVDLVTH